MAKRTHEEMSYPEMAFFMNESLSDVVFVIEGQRMPAIKQLLIIKSPVFAAMFSGNFCESKEPKESKLHEIEIKDTTFDAFKTLIRFIYTEQLIIKDDNDLQNFFDVCHLSDRYEVLRLRQRIGEHLVFKINIKHLISISRKVFAQNNEELMSKVMTFIETNIKEVIKWNLKKLKKLNDATNDRLLDVLTGDGLESNDCLQSFVVENKTVFIKKEVMLKNTKNFEFQIRSHSFDVFKVIVGYLYFDKLILKGEDDIQLIRESCQVFIWEYRYKLIFECIGNHLKDRITVENVATISRIGFTYRMQTLMKSVKQFIEQNITEILTKSDEQLSQINDSTDILLKYLTEFR